MICICDIEQESGMGYVKSGLIINGFFFFKKNLNSKGWVHLT